MAEVGNDYSGFDAGFYLRTRYSSVGERNGFLLQCFHDSYKKYHGHWDQEKSRLLELGGGPSIHPLISAAPFVSEIVFSDYAEDCRKQVQLWKDNDPKGHDWSPYLKYVVNRLEGLTDPEAVNVRERTLRDKIRSIVPCDANAEHPLGGGVEPGTFDVVSMSGCLEAAVHSPSEYVKALGKVRSLLKVGGLLISAVYLGATWWKVQGENYHPFPLTEELVVTSMQQTGFTLLERRFSKVDAPIDTAGQALSNVKGILFVVAKAT